MWLANPLETYRISQACPWWVPPDDETGDFNLLVMARIHNIHENHRLQQQAEMMGAAGG